MQRILVCDDDGRTVRALRVIVRDAGFRVEAVSSANEALDAAALRPPAAAIVELALPDADGVELCRQLREWSAIPLIVLSAINEEHQKVRALNAGADDYVTKPFAPRELVARVRAGLRRAQGDTRDQRIEIEGGLAIDRARRAVYRDGREVHLTPIADLPSARSWREPSGAGHVRLDALRLRVPLRHPSKMSASWLRPFARNRGKPTRRPALRIAE